MPYHVRKKGSYWLIVRDSGGKVVGKSKTKKNAEASIRARMSGEKKPKKKKKGKKGR